MMTAKTTSRFAVIFHFVLILLKTNTAQAAGSVCRTYTGPVPNTFSYTWLIPLCPSGQSATFDVKVRSDFLVILSSDNQLNPNPTDSAHNLCLGCGVNTWSAIGPSKSVYWGALLDANNTVQLWLSWADGVIAVGRGKTVGGNTLMSYVDPSSSPVNFMVIGGGRYLGTVDITYCYDPLIYDRTFPIDTPDVTTRLSTVLDCGRLCVEDFKCKGYAVDRDVSPVGNTDCYIFYSISRLQFDPQHVLYANCNGTLPTI